MNRSEEWTIFLFSKTKYRILWIQNSLKVNKNILLQMKIQSFNVKNRGKKLQSVLSIINLNFCIFVQLLLHKMVHILIIKKF